MTFQAFAVSMGESGLEARVRPFRHKLEEMQAFVEGPIEVIDIVRQVGSWAGLYLVCNEMPDRRRRVPLKTPWCVQPVYGNFFICRQKNAEFASITKEDFQNLRDTEVGNISTIEPMPAYGMPGSPRHIEHLKALARQVKMRTQAWRKKGGPLDHLLQEVGKL